MIRDFHPGERSDDVDTTDTVDEVDPQHCVVYDVVVRDQTAGDLGLCGR